MTQQKRDVWSITAWGGLTLVFGILFLLGGLLIPAISFASGPVDPKGPGGLVAIIGLPSFAFGHVFGIIAMASDNAKSKKLARIGLATIWVGFLIGLILVALSRDRSSN